MLSNVGLPEVLLLAVIGLLVFGPERLPKAAADAGRLLRQLRQLRQLAHNAKAELASELGPELADLDLESLHPRRLVEEHVFKDG
ncbi:MAG TPA: sec-independent translocase [Mycobacteriales bacterium]|nr:sec-independent translocase [Mycobacteriales bacterium]